MGMFVHGDKDEKTFYDQQDAMQTLGINGSDLAVHHTDPLSPPTVKDVLLKTWAQDTREMAKKRIRFDATVNAYIGDFGGVQIENPNDKTLESAMTAYNKAIDLEEAYLDSVAEVGK